VNQLTNKLITSSKNVGAASSRDNPKNIKCYLFSLLSIVA
jgi:hypothetical protein